MGKRDKPKTVKDKAKAKLKSKGFLDKRVLVIGGILLGLVAVTLLATIDGKRTNPIVEDGKAAIKEVEEREQEERKENKKNVGKAYPSHEEVHRYRQTIPYTKNEIEVLTREYNKEIVSKYYAGELISRDDATESVQIKEGAMKRELDSKSVYSSIDVLSEEEIIPTSPYFAREEGFGNVGKYRVGYAKTANLEFEETGRQVRGDGYIAQNLTLHVYSMEEMTAKEFQDGFEELGVTLSGEKAPPVSESIRDSGVKEIDIMGSSVKVNSKKWKGANSMLFTDDWGTKDFNKSTVYPGTVVKMEFEVPMKGIYQSAEYIEADDSFVNVPQELTLVVGEYASTMVLVDGTQKQMKIRP